MKIIKKVLLENGFSYIKSDTNELPYFVKNNCKIYFSEYDINNFYLPILTNNFVQLFWTNNFEAILIHYEKQTSKKN